jgi:hypothetical protein
VLVQIRLQRKTEIQAQKRSEKAAKEAAVRDSDMRSYKHIMKVSCSLFCPDSESLGCPCRNCEHSLSYIYSTLIVCLAYLTVYSILKIHDHVQEENMMTSKEVSQKYSSFQDYEEDFM